MFRVPVDDFVTLDVAHVVVQDLLAQQVDQSLDGLGHLLWLDRLVLVLEQAREIEVWVGHLKALDVESVLEEDADVVQRSHLPEILPDFVTQDEDGLNDLL